MKRSRTGSAALPPGGLPHGLLTPGLLTLGLLTLGLLAARLSASGPARADDGVAYTCVQAKVHDSYSDGWTVRTTSSTTLKPGGREVYVLTLHAGNHYRVLACAEERIKDLDLVIYDADGNPVVSDDSQDREPVLEFSPPATARFYVVVSDSSPVGSGGGGVSTAVTFK